MEGKMTNLKREVELAETTVMDAKKRYGEVVSAPFIYGGFAREAARTKLHKAEQRLEKAQRQLEGLKAYCERTRA